jgi:hypothetical protein
MGIGRLVHDALLAFHLRFDSGAVKNHFQSFGVEFSLHSTT